VEIVELLVSPRHRWDGRPDAALAATPNDLVDSIDVRAGLGIVGDRYYNRRAHSRAAVTIMAAEPLAAYEVGLAAVRRNVLLRGLEIESHLGEVLTLDGGSSVVRLRLHRRANPCRWLDLSVREGAWRELRGQAGVRCEPLTSGVLRVGPVDAQWSAA
jgi:hypothetical protein